MSAERPSREVAYRVFAAEYDDSTVSHAESDEERAPNYVITPTGARVNRLFVVGTLTEVSRVNDEMVRARVVDSTGAFVVYAGQYQPDALAFFERIDPPAFVAVTGKARTFEPDDGDRVYTSIRPESIATVDGDTRDRWVVGTAERTLERIGLYAEAASLGVGTAGSEVDATIEAGEAGAATEAGEADGVDSTRPVTDALVDAGVPEPQANGVTLAMAHYGTTAEYLNALYDVTIDALEDVTGDRDHVESLDVRPGVTGDAGSTFDRFTHLTGVSVADSTAPSASSASSEPASTPASGASEPASTPASGAGTATVGDGDTTGARATGSASAVASTAESDGRADGEPDRSESTTDDAIDAESDALGDDDVDVGQTGDADPAVSSQQTDAGPSEESESELETELESESESSVEPDSSSDPDPEPDSEPDSEPDLAADIDGIDDTDEPIDDLGDFDGSSLSDIEAGEMYELDEEERREVEAEFGAEFTTGAEVDEPGAMDDSESAVGEPADAVQRDSGDGADASDEIEIGDDDAGDADVASPTDDGAETVADEGATDDDVGAGDGDAGAAGATTDADADAVAAGGVDATEADEEKADATEADEEDGDAVASDTVVDLQAHVIETMSALDDGDGADREALVETVASDTGASDDEIEDAIQDALMGGQCYEPDDGTLKAI